MVFGSSDILENRIQRQLELHPLSSPQPKRHLQRMGLYASQLKIDKLLREFAQYMEDGRVGVCEAHDLLVYEILFHACGKMKDIASIDQTLASMRKMHLQPTDTTSRYILRAYFE